MHHRYVRAPSGLWATAGTNVPSNIDFQIIDEQLYGSINGTDGGTWNPTSPIVIGGAGLKLGLTMKLPSTSYSRLVSLEEVHASNVHHRGDPYPNIAPQAITCPIQYSYDRVGTQTLYMATRIFVPLDDYLHNGATLSNVRLSFRVGKAHASVPATLPTIGILRVPGTLSGGAVGLRSTGILQTIATPVSGADWYREGALQTFNYVCNSLNVIDRSNYIYYALITEESGSGGFAYDKGTALSAPVNQVDDVGNIYHSLRLDFTAITDMTIP